MEQLFSQVTAKKENISEIKKPDLNLTEVKIGMESVKYWI